MDSHAQVNLEQLTDIAPRFGMDAIGEVRFGREPLGAQGIGLAFYRFKPNARLGFGHRHKTMEEMYLVLSGGGRIRIGDEISELSPRDVVYVAPGSMRCWEAGPEGLELVAFGSHAEGETTDMGVAVERDVGD
jgi:mannose-6-phosphate isomerase-like protein (cupin superfamily)